VKSHRKQKRTRDLQNYLSEYEVKYRTVRQSGVDNTYVHCSICRSDFSIGHGGIGEIAKQVKTSKHALEAAESGSYKRKIGHFFVDSSDKDLNVIRAETLFTKFLSSSSNTIYHVKLLFRKMYLYQQNMLEVFLCFGGIGI
jgi:hypothetical protein